MKAVKKPVGNGVTIVAKTAVESKNVHPGFMAAIIAERLTVRAVETRLSALPARKIWELVIVPTRAHFVAATATIPIVLVVTSNSSLVMVAMHFFVSTAKEAPSVPHAITKFAPTAAMCATLDSKHFVNTAASASAMFVKEL